ncbi:LuxR C-terminal-related transcriptional regulator [Actinomyces radicidentis]|nr:LuxR C-terminal-related transcriptional regulator [Actinomyces radicidentis]
MAVWSSVVDMVVLEPSLTDRVPGLAAWLRQGAPEPRGGSLDDRVIEVLLVDDDEAVAVISRLVLDAVVAGSIIWQVRANMACAARLRRSPELDVATLGISSDAVSSASVLLERARELAASHGMEFWVAAARRLEPEPEPEPTAPVASAPSSPNLTDTELQVARLAAQGWRNKEIAGELYMAVRTVELRLTGVYRALGISSRKDLAQALADAHLMED